VLLTSLLTRINAAFNFFFNFLSYVIFDGSKTRTKEFEYTTTFANLPYIVGFFCCFMTLYQLMVNGKGCVKEEVVTVF
jgi:hypothetical protein